MKKFILYPVLAIFLFIPLVGASSCGSNDAEKGTRDTGAAKAIINMPNHFNNVAFKCRGTKGVYVTNNNGDAGTGSALSVVLNDPECGS